jgi:alpha-tubulin suppressor-like RCC1 family protein
MGNSHTLAIRNGSLYGWGNNDYRQLTSSTIQQEYKYPTKLNDNND